MRWRRRHCVPCGDDISDAERVQVRCRVNAEQQHLLSQETHASLADVADGLEVGKTLRDENAISRQGNKACVLPLRVCLVAGCAECGRGAFNAIEGQQLSTDRTASRHRYLRHHTWAGKDAPDAVEQRRQHCCGNGDKEVTLHATSTAIASVAQLPFTTLSAIRARPPLPQVVPQLLTIQIDTGS